MKLRKGNVFSRVCHSVHGDPCTEPFPPRLTCSNLNLTVQESPLTCSNLFTEKYGQLSSGRLAFDRNTFLFYFNDQLWGVTCCSYSAPAHIWTILCCCWSMRRSAGDLYFCSLFCNFTPDYDKMTIARWQGFLVARLLLAEHWFDLAQQSLALNS